MAAPARHSRLLPPPSPRWRRRAEARPEEILEAALAVFTERGFEAARMEDVARRAGLSKAGVYLYFESKEALLKALIETKMAPIAQQARDIAAAGVENPRSALETMLRVMIMRLCDPKNVAVPRLVLAVAPRFPEIAEHYRTRVIELGRSALETLVAQGVASGDFRPIDPSAAARAFIGPVFFEALWTHVFGGKSGFEDPERMVRNQLDVILNGIAKERSA
jgi:AcrR family transcriptional regulator